MSDQRSIHDLLSRAADHLGSDPDAALERVVDGARRRTRQTHQVLVAAAAFAVLLVAGFGFAGFHNQLLGTGPAPATGEPTVTTRASSTLPLGTAADELNGEWQTNGGEVGAVRSQLRRAGISPSIVDEVLGRADRWIVQMTFSPGLVIETWDPRRPSASLRVNDSFGWHSLPGKRIAITRPYSGRLLVMTYGLVGDTLRLRIQGTPTSDDIATARLLAWTARPLQLVR